MLCPWLRTPLLGRARVQGEAAGTGLTGKEKTLEGTSRITDFLELEGTFKGHLVQLLYSEYMQPNQVAQGLIQPHLESLQWDGASTASLGNLFQ